MPVVSLSDDLINFLLPCLPRLSNQPMRTFRSFRVFKCGSNINTMTSKYLVVSFFTVGTYDSLRAVLALTADFILPIQTIMPFYAGHLARLFCPIFTAACMPGHQPLLTQVKMVILSCGRPACFRSNTPSYFYGWANSEHTAEIITYPGANVMQIRLKE